jgi:hypothetical protein
MVFVCSWALALTRFGFSPTTSLIFLIRQQDHLCDGEDIKQSQNNLKTPCFEKRSFKPLFLVTNNPNSNIYH